MRPPRYEIFAGAAAITAVLLALTSCSPKENKLQLEPSQALGAELARETRQAAGMKKQVVLILPQWAANSTTGESFKAALKKQSLTVAFTIVANVGDPMGRDPLSLKSADFLNALQKGAETGAIVSLAGAPLLNTQDMAQVGASHPPVLVVATRSLGNVLGVPVDRNYLTGLLDAKVVQLAIVDRDSELDSKPTGQVDATQQLFSQNYSILRGHD